ncbi:MAG: acetylglutamate kinase [Planctomycetota bacterium]|jgi:acetylglutamate kinase
MEKAIKKAKAIIEAMPYIRSFNGKIVVIKLGGSILEDTDLHKKLLTDIVFMATVGIRPIIVHGGGKAITKAMAEAGLEPTWVHGRRYTDQRTLNIVEHTLVNKINTPFCEIIKSLGCEAMGLHSLSSCVLFAEPLRLTGEKGRKLDLGLVGQIIEINSKLLNTLCESGTIPVIASVACEKTGGKLNVNADNAAARVAAAVKAEKLVFLSDTHGILTDLNNPDSRISSLSEADMQEMVRQKTITAGMMPKVDACITALDGGVKKAHIIDGRIEHSLLLEIYTDKGVGTQIIK